MRSFVKTLAFLLLMVLVVGLAMSVSGCVSIFERMDDTAKIEKVYQPTRICASLVAEPFRSGRTGEAQMAQAYATFLLPIFVIDLPLDAVIDTLALPWDIYRVMTNEGESR